MPRAIPRSTARASLLALGLLVIGAPAPRGGSAPADGWVPLGSPGAAGLAAQQDDLARLRRVFSAREVSRIDAVIREAETDGVPRPLLIGKAIEGAAKGMSAEIVRQAVVVYADELRIAVELLGPGAEPRGLEKTADALRHGVDGSFIASLAARDPRELPAMLQVIEDLLHEGVSLSEAQAVVREASGSGLSGAEALSLPAAVRRLIRSGSSPTDAVSSVRRSLRSGRPTGPPPGLGSRPSPFPRDPGRTPPGFPPG